MKVNKYEVPTQFKNSNYIKKEYDKHNEFADKVNSTDDAYQDFCANCLCDSWFDPLDDRCLYCGE